MSQINWCEYFSNIEKDPRAITPQVTIRQLLEARAHVASCQNCSESVDRVLAQAPKEEFPERGTN